MGLCAPSGEVEYYQDLLARNVEIFKNFGQ